MPARPLLALYCAALSAGALAERIDKTPLEAVWRRSVACHPSGAAEKAAAAPGCVAADCHVAVYDGFLNATTVQTLREIADAGVARTAPGDRAASAAGGPTIMDINSGYVMIPGQRLVNVYVPRARLLPLLLLLPLLRARRLPPLLLLIYCC